MKPKVYVETTVISYLVARPSRDVVVAAHQQVTRDWWKACVDRFEFVASELVVREASGGDQEAARERLDALEVLALLEASEEALTLARQLVQRGAVAKTSAEDALHIAIAATGGIDYLVTWNCRHIANAAMRSHIETTCRLAGYEPPIICTPEELMEVEEDVE
jgi:predicted nucleic acid-binding protein